MDGFSCLKTLVNSVFCLLTNVLKGCKLAQMKQDELDPIVKEIAKANTRKMIDRSLRDIQQEILERTGYTPSTSILSASLKRLGAKASGHRWLWRHNAERHE